MTTPTTPEDELITKVEAACDAEMWHERKEAILRLWQEECARLGVDPDEMAREVAGDFRQAWELLGRREGS
jgi:hypothetical protein